MKINKIFLKKAKKLVGFSHSNFTVLSNLPSGLYLLIQEPA